MSLRAFVGNVARFAHLVGGTAIAPIVLMSHTNDPKNASPESSVPKASHAREEAAVLGGLVGGSAIGIMAGPPGIIAGAIVGTVVGALAAVTLHKEEAAKEAHERELDEEIGIDGGHIGEASPNAPKAKIGAFSSAASGAGGGSEAVDSAGPIPALEPGA